MMLHRFFLRFVAAVLLLAGAARGADIVISKSSGKMLMDWSSFAAGGDAASQTFRKTLEADLLRSGWFARGQPGRSDYVLTGSAEGGGNLRVKCWVTGRVDRRNYLGKGYTAGPNDVVRLAHQVADEIVKAVTGRDGMASARLVMVGNASGAKELYLCDADGGNPHQLTRDRRVCVGPNWGPDGRRIVYTSDLKGFPDIYLIDTVTGDRSRVASYGGLNTGAAIAPNGRDMALILSKDGNPELYVKNLQSGALTRLTSTRQAAEASPSWSPDGSRIAYVSDQSGSPQVYVIAASGGVGQRLTSRGSQNVAPDWGRNGQIAYSSLQGGRYGIWVIDPATRASTQITADGADYEDPSWAPNQRHIACTRTVQYQSKVYLLDTMGDPPIALTNYKGDWFAPSWSPLR